ncbi:MAG: molybdate ABC transporter substrate-binding protein [Planctomycetes bacterium]|nr:molybdate ABC transporter substrate-binding protein [Planctomycetota bacterium]
MRLLGLALCASALAAAGCPGDRGPAPATVAVAAAADLKFALDEVIAEFQRAHPTIGVHATYGSSGNFFGQLTNEAPFDLYLSADTLYPRRLAEAGQALDDPFVYAYGRLVVWAPRASPVDVEGLGPRALVDPAVRSVAIANPQHAPYGRAALAALESFGVRDEVGPRLVFGENIAQTAQFVDTGNADIGVIALSLALAPTLRERGKLWRVPEDAYPVMEQGGVVLRWARDPAAARALRDFLRGPAGRAVLERYGFGLP